MITQLVVSGYLFHQDKLLLIHHKKLNKWLPPGGHMHPNETPDEAVVREFKEETNLDVAFLQRDTLPVVGTVRRVLALPFHVNVHDVGDHDHCCLFYLCKPTNPQDLTPNLKEVNSARWFSKEELEKEEIPEDVKAIGKKAFALVERLPV